MNDLILPIAIDFSKAVAVESRDGTRKAKAVVVDWLRPGIDGRFPVITGTLPNPPGAEGGSCSISQGDWLIQEGADIHPVHRDAFARDWRDVAAEERAAVERAAKAKAQAVLDAQVEDARKAKEIADAKRLIDEKNDAAKRARDGSGA